MSMRKPFAITLDVGSSLANRTGSWRTERPVYLHRAGAVQEELAKRGVVVLPDQAKEDAGSGVEESLVSRAKDGTFAREPSPFLDLHQRRTGWQRPR